MMLYLLALIGATAIGYIISTLDVPTRIPMKREYWFSELPKDSFTIPSSHKRIFMHLTLIIMITIFIVLPYLDISIFTPHLYLLYAILPSIYILFIITGICEVVDFGEGNYDLQILVGLVIAGVSLILLWSAPKPEVTLTLTLATIYFIGFAVPIVEEFIFGNVIPTTLIKEFGIVSGTLISSAMFVLFYLVAFQYNWYILLAVLVFRLLSTIALIRFGSFLPSFVAHVVINLAYFALS